jgi:hypothetical protein
MIPVDQTLFDSHFGNCWAACLASIFEIPLESIPFPNGNDDDFWPIYHAWLAERNATVVSLTRGEWVPAGLVIGSVVSPRFDGVQHAVVVLNNMIIHDPHPSKDSECDDFSKVIGVDLIFPLDPSKPMRINPKVGDDLQTLRAELANSRTAEGIARELLALKKGDPDKDKPLAPATDQL